MSKDLTGRGRGVTGSEPGWEAFTRGRSLELMRLAGRRACSLNWEHLSTLCMITSFNCNLL